MARQPTIRDVAQRAGVSHQTVSRVINGHELVSSKTRDRVERAIRELNYVPSPIAQGLISNRTHSIGLVSSAISDHFFGEVAAGAEVEARRRGYYLVIASVEEHAEADEQAYLRLMLERRVEALIVARSKLPISVDQVSQHRVPVVAIASAEAPGLTVVDVDNRTGGKDAVAYLLSQGHRRIATVTGPIEWRSSQQRLDGYREALAAAGVAFDPALVEQAHGWDPADGQAAMARLLARGTTFTALFAYSDLIAIGAIKELRLSGLRVPENVSVVGYDDIPVAAFVDPPLTTIHQPMREVGECAASLVLDAIANGGMSETRLLPAWLVVRGSVIAPAG
jgi:LacI family transcriptional regulator, galactose operon repressor